MDLNSIFFPAPKCSYKANQLQGKLIWVPRIDFQQKKKEQNEYNILQKQKKLYLNRPKIKLNKMQKIKIPQQQHMVPEIDSESFMVSMPREQQQSFIVDMEEQSNREILELVGSPRQIQKYTTRLIQKNCFISDDKTQLELDEFSPEKNKSFQNVNQFAQNKVKYNSTQKQDPSDFISWNSQQPSIDEDNLNILRQNQQNQQSVKHQDEDIISDNFSKLDDEMRIQLDSLNDSYQVKQWKQTNDFQMRPNMGFTKSFQKINLYNTSNSSTQDLHQLNSNLIKNHQSNNHFSSKSLQQQQHLNTDISIHTTNKIDKIPCYFLQPQFKSPYVLIYFHGNGEDIYLAHELVEHLKNQLKINILSVEYPGYGLYKGSSNESVILQDAEIIYKFLVYEIGYSPDKIIILGRSIGSGPATYLASKFKVRSLILVSPFTSIRAVVGSLLGNITSYIVKERFDNLSNIQSVSSPTMIIHGKLDKLIPFQHSIQLTEKCGSYCLLRVPPRMNHSEFDFLEDLTKPLIKFLNENNLGLDSNDIFGNHSLFIQIPPQYFITPFDIKKEAR